MTLVGVRDGFISAQVSESSPSLKRQELNLKTSAKLPLITQKPVPYAFSRTLQVFKHFMIAFMAHCMTRIPR